MLVKNVTQYIETMKEEKEFQEKHMNDTLTSLGSSKYKSEDSNPDILNDAVKPKKIKRKKSEESLEENENDDGEYQYSHYSEEDEMTKDIKF